MALNTFKCNCLTPLHFKGLKCISLSLAFLLSVLQNVKNLPSVL